MLNIFKIFYGTKVKFSQKSIPANAKRGDRGSGGRTLEYNAKLWQFLAGENGTLVTNIFTSHEEFECLSLNKEVSITITAYEASL